MKKLLFAVLYSLALINSTTVQAIPPSHIQNERKQGLIYSSISAVYYSLVTILGVKAAYDSHSCTQDDRTITCLYDEGPQLILVGLLTMAGLPLLGKARSHFENVMGAREFYRLD